MTKGQKNVRVQKFIVAVAVVLFVIKMAAWYFTGSVAVLTDGLESIVNVISGFIGLYSLSLSAKPKDANHPYGHGKVEFISAGIEGTLIAIAGLFIIYEAIQSFIYPEPLQKLDLGIVLIALSAVVNYTFGWWAYKTGKENDSLALQASGKHLQTDTYTTLGIIGGLILIRLTNILWLDGAVAILFALIIMRMGFRILRVAVAGIMDETDEDLLEELIAFLQANRDPKWIDLHNLRIIKYGRILHVDCHLTLPWYLTVKEAHAELDKIEALITEKFGNRIEIFIHTDYCMEFSCRLCQVENCKVRRHPFEEEITWTVENVASNRRHKLK
ncbi:cation diffusion facilitator family transporter [Gracilimonas mengyeensis]|uniref:Cation diffusion facilitator family transporter n=1 Tax=Gracilimonas mengyeensis TaxID=1302730 RepID=A0A521F167_9BACT|nr:cation diffusion facilitator family transporter [Gracilimonas mengyeensis]SMO89925.1 cation diffusion facilitator family transporter [Gracilimonas mengyeensis]